MSLLLDNIKMPKKYPVSITVWPNGIYVATTISGRKFSGSVREISENERLIDANALDLALLMEQCKTSYSEVYSIGISDGLSLARECVEEATTISAFEEEINECFS